MRATFCVSDHPGCRMAKRRAITSVPLKTLTDFIEEFARYFSGSSHLKCYRGQRDSSWPNVAGIFRPELKELLEDEKRAVRKLISVQPHEFASDETMFDNSLHQNLNQTFLEISCTGMHEPAVSRMRFQTSRLVSNGWVISHSPAPAPLAELLPDMIQPPRFLDLPDAEKGSPRLHSSPPALGIITTDAEATR